MNPIVIPAVLIIWGMSVSSGFGQANVTPPSKHQQFSLVDSGVDDAQYLAQSIADRSGVGILAADQQPLVSILGQLRANPDVTDLHLYSHGEAGRLSLGGQTIDMENLTANQVSTLKAIGDELGEQGGIYFYGCNLAAGDTGQSLVNKLADIAGVDVWASDDLTGSNALAGDWQLEVASSNRIAKSIEATDYQATLNLIVTPTLDPTELVNLVMDPANQNVVVDSVTVFGFDGQIAKFTNGLSIPGFVDFEEGIIISSGTAVAIEGPNTADNTGTNVTALAGADGDVDFNALTSAPQGTFDAAYIEITFTPQQNSIQGSFVFASEEYNEYAPPAGVDSPNNTYYDVMAFFVNGVNYSVTAAGENVSINTVNETLNAADFITNDPTDGSPTPVSIAPDGFTKRLIWTAPVNIGVANTLKFGVADGGDATYDSWLLIDKYAFEVLQAPVNVDLAISKTDNLTEVVTGNPITYEFTVTNTGSAATGREIVLVDTLPAGVTVNGGSAEAVVEVGPNAEEWNCQSNAATPQVVTCKSTVPIQTNVGNNSTVLGFVTDPITEAPGATLVNSVVMTSDDIDISSGNNTASDSSLVTATDTAAPVASLSGVPILLGNTDPFTVSVAFNEDVTGVDLSDLSVVGGVASNLVSVDGRHYTAVITPDGSGDVVVGVIAGAAQDAAGNANAATATQTATFAASAVELNLLNVPAQTSGTSPYTVTFEFSEDVVGFDDSDITVINGIASNFVVIDANTYTADVQADGTGDVQIQVLGGAAQDTAGVDQTLSASGTTILNLSAPTVMVSGQPAVINTANSYPLAVEFSEDVTGFDAADISLSNATILSIVPNSGSSYTVTVQPDGNGDVAIVIPADSVIDVASNGNVVSNTVNTVFDSTGPQPVITGLPVRTNSGLALPITITFDEPVTGFDITDLQVVNGSVANFVAIDSQTFTADVMPNGLGDIDVTIPPAAASDTIGNLSSVATPVTVLYDDTPPTLTIAPVTGDNIINALEDDTDVVVSGTSVGLENGQTVTVAINGTDYTTTANNDSWSITLPAAAAQLLDPTEQITANAIDLAGNAAPTATTDLIHDTAAPAEPVVSSLLTNNVQPIIMGSAVLEAGDILQVTVEGVTYTAGAGDLVVNPDDSWELAIPATQTLPEGVLSVAAIVTDSSGNVSADVTANEVVVDITAPTNPLVAPDLTSLSDSGSIDTDNVTQDATGEFTVATGTLTADEIVTLYANGIASGTTIVLADGSFSADITSLADSIYAIQYSVTDAAGNESGLSPSLNVTVDTVIAVPTIDGPIATDDVINAAEQSAVLVSGTAEPNSLVVISFIDTVNPDVTAQAVTDAAGNYSLLGSEADIQSLAEGNITISVTATDLAGNSEISAPTIVALDANAPAVPVIDTLITNSDTPQLTGSVALVPGDQFEVVVNGVTYVNGDGKLVVDGAGVWTLDIPVGNELSEAQYEILATVVDSSGNSSVDASSSELTIDLTPPAVPSVVTSVQGTDLPIINGTATLAPGESLAVVVDGETYAEGTDLVVTGTNWQLTIPTGNEIADGVFSVDAVITDAAGNSTPDISAAELTIDTVLPATPTVIAQTTNNTQPVLMGTAIVEAGESLSVTVNGVTYTEGDGNLVLNPDDTWVLMIPSANAVVEGVYNVDVQVTDAAGNSSTESTVGELIVDTTSPVVPAVAPNLQAANDTGVSDVDNVTSTIDNTFDVPPGTANPGDTVVLYADGVEVATTIVAADGSFVASASTLTDGSYAIRYTLADEAGNVSALSPTLNIEIDTSTTLPLIDQPIEVDNVVNIAEQSDVLISGTAEANSQVLVTLTDASLLSVQQVVTTDGSGVWSLTGQELDMSSLQDGVIEVTADATDVAGNTQAATPVAITLDRVVPVVTIDPIAIDNIINAVEDDASIAISGAVADVEDGQSVSITLNGKSYSAVVVGGVWSFALSALDAQALSPTSTLTADVDNANGNSAVQATAVLIHDTTIPEITVNPVALDNIVNATEDDSDVVISGTSVGIEDGQQVAITLDGQVYNATVTADTWAVTVPAANALALPASTTLTADAQDVAGNVATQQSVIVIHDVVAPSVAITNAVIANAANSSTYAVSGSCTPGDNNVVVQIAGATPASQAVLCNASGEWTAAFDVSAIADGSDVIVVDARQADVAGNTATAPTVLQDKDVSIPSISIGVVAGDNYVNAVEDDTDVIISGTASSIEDGQSIQVVVNSIAYFGSVSGGTWSVTVPAANVQAWSPSETITADGSNIAGTAAETASSSVSHDTTLPATPAVTVQVTNSTQPTISGTATLAPGDVLSVTVGGQSFTAGDGFLVVNPDGTWVLSVDQPLTQAVYDVMVTVTDVAGNSASEVTVGELTVDTTSPATPLVAPDLTFASDSGIADSDDITNVANAVFSVPAGTATAGETVELFAGVQSIGTGIVNPDGSFEIATAIVTDDQHAISYQLTDVAGNTSLDSPALSVTLDTQIAQPTLTIPVAGDDYIGIDEATTVVVNGTAEADSTLVVTFSDGINPDVTETVTAAVDGSWSATVDVSGLADGSLAIVVESTDIAGNTATSATHNVELDTVPGAIPTVDQLATNTGTPTLTGTAVLAAGDELAVEVNNSVYSGGAGALVVNPDNTWVLTLPAGDALLDGQYEVLATITDSAANITTDATTTELLIDTVVPTAPTVDPLVSSGDTPVLTGSMTLLAGEELEVTLNSITYTLLDPELTDNGDGTWSLAVDAANALNDGIYEVIASVVDAAGNVASDSTNNELLVDTTPPAVPTVSSVISNLDTPQITGTATVLSGEMLVVTVNTIDYTPGDGALVYDISGNWTLTIPIENAVADATYDVTASVTDLAGNATVDTTSQELAVDTTVPLVPTVNSVIANTETPTLTGTATVAAGEMLQVTVAGVTYIEGNGQLNLTGTDWILDIPIGNELSQAVYNVAAVVTDTAGNTSTDTSLSELTIDTTAPAIPTVVAQITNTATPVISGTANLNNGESLSVTVDGVEYTTANGLSVIDNNWFLAIPAGAALTETTYLVTAVAMDLAGNSASDTTIDELIIDLTAPSITLDAIAIDNNINATEDDTDVVISGSTVGVEAGESVSVTIDGGVALLATVDAAGLWSTVLPASTARSLNASVTVSADVQDAAGNDAVTATQVLVHDVDVPIVSINAATVINSQNVSNYTLSGTCTAGEEDVQLSVSNGTPASQLVACDVAGEWQAVIDFTAAAEGTAVVQVSALQSDASGNSSVNATTDLNKDTQGPGIAISDNGSGGDDFYNTFEHTNIAISGTTTNVENFQQVSLTISDGTNSINTSAAVNANVWSIAGVDLSVLDEGPLTVTAIVDDASGNSSVPAVSNAVLDTIAPVVTANNIGPSYLSTPELFGTSDLPDGAIVNITNPDNLPICTAVISAGSWQCTPSQALGDSSHNLVASVVDEAGNGVSVPFTVIVDSALDTDGDGIVDLDEGELDTDNDGIVNRLDTDSDGDGIDDATETDVDSDNDGIANYLDLDSDNDGLPDSTETTVDSDVDGIANYIDLDSDNDGVGDLIEAGVPAALDADNDMRIDGAVGINGIADSIEIVLDNAQIDFNADGAADLPADTDGDSISDYLDLDSDNDGIVDVVEAGGVEGQVGKIAGFADLNGDGLHDSLLAAPLPDTDTDTDGVVDRLSTDSDGDGITDVFEAGGSDADTNGQIDGFTDTDFDGLHDDLATTPLPDTDTDADLLADRLDLDSDGDGINDAIERGTSTGTLDTDSDGIPNQLDLDSDDDGLTDADEGVVDLDGDGRPDYIDNNALTDTDNDGINDNIEGTADLDGDGIANFLDTDSDGDGIDDSIETAADQDGDGIPNFLDLDADGDGIADALETAIDTDGDLIANFLDTDSDNDAISDTVEAGADAANPIDTDADGIVDFLDLDSDDDGITDLVEGSADPDGDMIANYLDPDSDGDGISDALEGPGDLDNDGIPNSLDADSDDDGISDFIEGAADADGDGIANAFDTDSDADGIPDATEGLSDPDADGIANYLDTDSDGDTALDITESAADADGDGVANYLDTDSDGDGIADSLEHGPVAGSPIDTDADTTPDFLDLDSDGDGIPDAIEGNVDSDGDGVADFLDLDSDGDGIPDSVETAIDSDGDGAADYVDLDSDSDGVNDVVEAGLIASSPQDTDADGIPDYLDADSDGDGITDLIEGSIDSDGDGIPDLNDSDSNGDGLPDLLATAEDTDGDGIPNYLDADIDGDGISNITEGLIDSDSDGIPDYLDTDTDGDGIPDLLESSGDADGDGVPNYLDTDSDGDSISDAIEAGSNPAVPLDSDADGTADFLDTDADGDGIPDAIELTQDIDADNIPNYLDPDSDGDSIADAIEGNVDTDADGQPNYLDTDSDGDGRADIAETAADTDADGIANYLDLDSDADNISDQLEGSVDTDGDGIFDFLDADSDGDGIPDLLETVADTDGDGAANYVDLDSDSDGLTDQVEAGVDPTNPLDTDADGTADYLDLDSDGDGIPDSDEGTLDSDGDGIPDVRDEDSNNDGITDAQAGLNDTDGDGVPNYLDGDIDGDGIANLSDGIIDSDGDGILNYLDTDSDDDGLLDSIEGIADVDGDGLANFVDTDSDGDAILDQLEGITDPDGDLIASYLDTDSDGDGILDSVEGVLDTDGDTLANYLDTDSDGDGINDSIESGVDTDNDGIVDYLDPDSDNDGIADSVEYGQATSGLPAVDTDGDGIADYIDSDSDNDGLADSIETAIDTDADGIANYLDTDSDGDTLADSIETSIDTDADGIPNYLDLDSDNDGINDSIESSTDTDADGIANFLDPDSDGDGIADALETTTDTDVDGIANYLDLDSDGDSVSDLVEAGADPTAPVDTDTDGTPDFLDTDSDNDGILDLVEGSIDWDGDGIINLRDPDDNNDGIPDAVVGTADTDGDGIPDYLDDDIDGDGVPNINEGMDDADADGIPNFLDLDSDGDGIADSAELLSDPDGDGVPNYLDLDSDGDGILDAQEGVLDTDADGIPNYLDLDSDGDGTADQLEGSADTDADGIPNYIDLDADGDGIDDLVEGAVDFDSDGIPNYLDSDSDGDGINDSVEAGPTPANPVDTDADGSPDYLDLDSDNDGISDELEGSLDSDGDGIPDSSDPDSNNDGIPDADVGTSDTDGDGIPDYLDGDIDGDGISNAIEGIADTDGDGIPNYLDSDSDGDGIPDASESANDADGDGLADFLDIDSDGDGISDTVENLFDTDTDGIPNYLDTDSDNDGINDVIESTVDTDGDGVANYLDLDSDADGITDAVEGSSDADADGSPNYIDTDSDGDQIPDQLEGQTDVDGDGVANYLDLDSEDDGIPDLAEMTGDVDGDGIPNFIDLDADGDGVPDSLETDADTDGDGVANFLDIDADGDGIDDVIEAGVDATNPIDTDADGIANFLDSDSDADGISDAIEGLADVDLDTTPNYLDLDSDNDGISDLVEGILDTDADGVLNAQELDSDNDGIPDQVESAVDTDGDGLPDYIDTDVDNDGIDDAIETDQDADSDGVPNYLDTDSDGDGIPDLLEGVDDVDGDSLPNYLDTDSDGDGLDDTFEARGDTSLPADTDGDGIKDFLDVDSDGDGIDDNVEGLADTDSDGFANYLDQDSDGDGIPDQLETVIDTDSDGVPNYIDTDSDDDGITDFIEAGSDPTSPIDSDADGIANYLDLDSDEDGINDAIEGAADTDSDTIPNYLDPDSDGDGISDELETAIDSDNDAVPNFLDIDSDGDGIPDLLEGVDDVDGDSLPNYLDTDSDGDGFDDTTEARGDTSLPADTDADGIKDFLDVDSDGDGIEDSVEGNTDTDFDGFANYLDQDSDGDGIPDLLETEIDTDADGVSNYLDSDSDGDGIADFIEAGSDPTTPIDTDTDGVANYLDSDSDEDGITDAIEGAVDIDGDTIPNYLDSDSDGDGISDQLETATDTDGDTVPNFLDTDSDGDGIPDLLEGVDDVDGDLLPNYLDTDSDGDGFDDTFEARGDTSLPADTDGDGIKDFLDVDSDGDGIEDSVEGLADTDSDGFANYLDQDSDGDGISDQLETTVDTDGDGVPNYLDLDSDGDTISDFIEGIIDTDADGVIDALELDSDNDGIPDQVESATDSDGDGLPDYTDTDVDNDGIDDAIETDQDTDGDGIPNFQDTDSDGDGIPDILEGADDVDGDSLPNFLDTDSDGDGFDDTMEARGDTSLPADTDADGIKDFLDVDSDGDGIEDSVEGLTDTDFDGFANYLDPDSDGDGIPDQLETAADTDGDGVPNYLDEDSDGDNINDSIEAGDVANNPQDTDSDGIPDFMDVDSDGDGIADSVENNAATGTVDQDGDSIPNYLDLDSDNDSIPDVIEGDADSDGDLSPDYLDEDSDNDGLLDSEEGTTDVDGDGIPNNLDLDSDGDGLLDAVELMSDTDGDGIPNSLDVDSDGDGIADAIEVGSDPAVPVDTDVDGIPDFLDTDSDGDGIEDQLEGAVDTDGDGLADYLDTDADGDGIEDSIEGVTDTDSDGVPDFIDTDSDGDGVDDAVEVGLDPSNPVDTDNDGVPDYLDNDGPVIGGGDLDGDGIADVLDNDIDGDGIPNSAEPQGDTDGDGIPDFLDTDSDNDGLPDAVEGAGDADGDGVPNFIDTDSDGDGIADVDEQINEADGDGVPNYLDTDSDNDGIPDSVEGNVDSDNDGIPDFIDFDSDGDGIIDLYETSADADSDGIPNHIDTDSDNDGIADSAEGRDDVDGDGLPNYLDVDSDDDGIIDSIEGDADTDNDGVPNFIDTDSDNDLTPDSIEGEIDADGNGVPDYIDFSTTNDTDGDGISDAIEGAVDTDSDGISDYLDLDSDGDGISDAVEGANDSDADGIPDYLDGDSDQDGVLDSAEGDADTDGDGVPNYIDSDADGDGVPDLLEGNVDSDGDGVIDALDIDSDNDGVIDLVEAGRDTDGDGVDDAIDLDSDNDGIPDLIENRGIDANNDGEIDSFVDQNQNGLHDGYENAGLPPVDSDGDQVPDYRDIDSDNDGLTDAFEADHNDVNRDGRVDNFQDANGNGLDDSFDLSPVLLVDTDNDLIPDYRDVDSDQDGMPDLNEARGDNFRGDGVIEGFVDSNGDGLDDSLLIAPIQIEDTDQDGVFNHRELDSDNDGVTDATEVATINQLGVVDELLDTDGDGIPDLVDIDQAGGVDTDNDGIINAADSDANPDAADTDFDGIIDAFDADADGNGFADLLGNDGLGAALPDIDADSIPDYLEAENERPVRTGINGSGCSIGGSSTDSGLLLLMLVAVFGLAIRRRRVLAVMLLALIAANAQAQEVGRVEAKFDKGIYLAAGFGVSMLNPDTEGTRWENDSSNSTGFQIGLGYDFNKRISAELHFTQLGEATIKERADPNVTDSIGYQNIGASVLLYASSDSDNLFFREGFLGYIRAGVGSLSNTFDKADVEQVNATHFLLGIGLEYAMENGLGVRGEIISFDGDMKYGQLSLLYRFGHTREKTQVVGIKKKKPIAKPIVKPKPKPAAKPIAKPKPIPKPKVVPKPVAKPAPVIKPKPKPVVPVAKDTDKDGVIDRFDRCSNTKLGTPVDKKGCELFVGVVEGITFEVGSAQLTAESYSVLNNVVVQLLKFPNIKISINAHTDNDGDDKYNLALSRKRAISVARYIVQKGISQKRLQAKAFGESKPIANNNTAAGRKTNRRVELRTFK